jgi:hypothetical protein
MRRLRHWFGVGSSRRRPLRTVLSLERLEDRLALSGVWTFQGPGPILEGQPEGMDPQGNPDVGAVNALAPGPNVNVLYAATTSGGVWKTTNATATVPTWVPLTENQPNLSFGDVAVSPLDGNTLFAATGHFTNGDIGADGLPFGPVGDGVLKSTDGGQSWTLLGQSQFAGQNIRTILPTPVATPTGQVVLAGTLVDQMEPPPADKPQKGGLYYSADGGNTWARLSGATGSPLPDDAVTSLVEDPLNPNVVYAAVPGHGVFQSTDAGLEWAPVSGNLPSNFLQATTNLKLAMSVSGGSTTLFLLTAAPSDPTQNRSPGVSYLFYTTNQGTSWSEMAPVPLINGDDQENNNLALTADPTSPTVVWVTGSAAPSQKGLPSVGIVYRGDYTQPSDGQWVVATGPGAIGTPPGGSGNNITLPHSDSRSLTFDAAGNLLLTDDGGIYKLVNPEEAPDQRYWVSVNGTLQNTEFYAAAYDSINHIVVGGAQDNGMAVQPQPGQTAWNTGFFDDVTHVAVDNSGANALLYGIGPRFLNFDMTTGAVIGSDFMRGVFTTQARNVATQILLASPLTPTDFGSGLDSSDASFTGFASIPFVLDTVNPQHLLIGLNGLYESADQGDVIQEVMSLGTSTATFTALAYGGTSGGKDNPDVAFAGTSAGQVFVRTQLAPGGNPANFNLAVNFGSDQVVRSIALDPGDWHKAYVVTTDSSGVSINSNNVGHVWLMTIDDKGSLRGPPVEITGNLAGMVRNVETVAVVHPEAGTTTLVVGGLGTGSGGVFRSVGPISGASTQWALLGSGLPNVQIPDLTYNATDDVLVAATFGRGAWTLASSSRSLLPLSPPPPSPTSPPSLSPPPPSSVGLPTLVQQQLFLDVLLLPSLGTAEAQAGLVQGFEVAFVLTALEGSLSGAQTLFFQEAAFLLDLARGQLQAANALAANPLYNTPAGFALGVLEGELALAALVTSVK